MRKILVAMVVALAGMTMGGCAAYTGVQMELVEQARKGVSLCGQTQDSHREMIGRLFELERQRMDEAFDEDVRQQESLTTEWIIEHRKAYAAGLEMLAKQRAASADADAAAVRNLAAMDQALGRLYWLQSVQMKWTLQGEKKD